jgi:transposase InsO family protein
MLIQSKPSPKYEIIQNMTLRDNNMLNIQWLCDIAGVSRSGYYYWLKAEKARIEREWQDEADFDLILTAYKHRGYDKGARGIHMRLLRLNPPVIMNTKKISRLMKKFNLVCPVRKVNPYRALNKANLAARASPNLLNRAFRAYGARTVLLSDITYIHRRKRTADGPEKYSYLCVIMDAFTKEILAYSVGVSPDTDLVLVTVNLLMEKHGHELKTDTLIHSDQGCQYTSHRFAELLKSVELRQSMSRRACCWDNAPQESLFGHMKDEIHLRQRSDNHAIITSKINDWVDYYNNDRPQWSLAKLTPSEFFKYVTTGIYPLQVSLPQNAEESLALGGAAPEPPEFIASVSKEGEEKDDTVSVSPSPQTQ